MPNIYRSVSSKTRLIVELDEEYVKALKAINESYCQYKCLEDVVKRLIKDHLSRERGNIGSIKNGKFIE